MKTKSMLIFIALSIIFLFCVVGICRWPHTERLYFMLQPGANISEELAGLSKVDKLLMVIDEDRANFQYTREGVYPVNYTPDYIPLIVMSVGAGASFTVMLSMFLDFYIARKRRRVAL